MPLGGNFSSKYSKDSKCLCVLPGTLFVTISRGGIVSTLIDFSVGKREIA